MRATTSSRTSSSATPSGTGGSGLPRLKGVNTAGYDFTVKTDGSFTGTGSTPPTSQFPHFASQGFGLMNEPHDMPAIAPWVQAVQAAVNAIRAAGANSQIILIPGSSWSSAAALPGEAGPQLLTVTDPAGGVSKLVFDVHKYLDVDNSGTHDECTTDNLGVFQTLVSWLKQNNRQAILSETGGGHTQSCYTALNSQLAYIKNNYPTMLGFTVWSAGAFATTYELSVTPNADGSDQQLWIQAVKPN
ncbi:hypothetical protein FRC17_001836, partial [Serendipita sp. 399]